MASSREEQLRNNRRIARQILGLVAIILMLIGLFTVIGWCISAIRAALDDTDRRQSYADRLYGLVMKDYPELFWCDGAGSVVTSSASFGLSGSSASLRPEYNCTEEEKEERRSQIEEEAARCLAGIDSQAGDYEKILYVYEYVIRGVEYDLTAEDNQNIYSALVGKNSVCAGYSRAAQYLLNNMGIECIYVVGTAQGQEAHAWNIVNCGGNYYQMDVTFGDPVFLASESGENLPGNIIYYDYLCCTDEEIRADHTPADEVVYPSCGSDDLNYYKMNGMYYESYDPQILLGDMNDSIYERQEMFVCRFSSSEVYQQARDSVINELFPKAAQTLGSVYGLEQVKYTYIEDETHNKIMVFWNYQ